MSQDNSKIYGQDRFVSMTCPHCNRSITAELIELRLFTKIYHCNNCNREIHEKTGLGNIVPYIFGSM